MDEQQKHSPGPFEMKPIIGRSDVEIYSSATGDSIASVHVQGWDHDDAPDPETALHNAALLKAAPQLRQAVKTLLNDKQQQINSPAAEGLRSLLTEIDAGPTKEFLKERATQRREYDEVLQAQVDEMALQSDRRLDQTEEDQDEEQGPSFGF